MEIDWQRVRREREERAARAAARAREEAARARRLPLGALCVALGAAGAIGGLAIDRRALFVAGLQALGIGLALLLFSAVEHATGRALEELGAVPRAIVRGAGLLLMVAPAVAFVVWVMNRLG